VASLYLTEFQASGNADSGAQLQVGVQPAVRPRPRDTADPRGFSCSDKWVAETRDTED